MKNPATPFTGLATLGAMMCALILGPTPAVAAASSGSSSSSDGIVVPNREIDLTGQTIPSDATAVAKVRAQLHAISEGDAPASDRAITAVAGDAIPVPAGVQVRAGETLKVTYSDGVVLHQGISATCTATSSVTNPYKTNNTVRADHTYGLGSGCRDKTTVVALLDSYAPPLWHQRDFEQTIVSPKTTMHWGTVKGCVNSTTKTWHAENAVGSSTISLSADKRLACNPG